MNINYLIELLTNKLTGLTLAKDQAFQGGDLERINAISAEILDVENTISKLKLVSSIEQTAAATSFTEAEVVKNGIEISFNPTVVNDATKCLLEFNIEPYATDPDHEMKIQNILEKMPIISSTDLVDIYIKKSAPLTPLSGQMVINSSTKYNVDIRLMIAIMELDSRFGTEGVGARTFNPGNVGNTGSAERMYSTWDEGVDAVASWLNNHRRLIDNNQTPTEELVQPEPIEKITKKIKVQDMKEIEDNDITIEEIPVETPVVDEIATSTEQIIETPITSSTENFSETFESVASEGTPTTNSESVLTP